MAANLPLPSIDENVSTTLSSGITDVADSMDVASAAKIPSVCYLVIDRVDSNGDLKATSLWEYVKVTDKATNTLTITRGQGGSTAQAHSSSAIVEAVVTGTMFEDWYAALNPEHTAAGGHVMGTATVSTLLNSSANILGSASITTSLNVSSASVVGLGLNPSWYIPSLPSNATTGLGRPAAMPRAGTLKFVNVTLNGIISSASVAFDIAKNGTSIFDTIGRPLIANGTFVSTASIKTTTFNAGDVLRVDYSVAVGGGNSVDAIVTASAQ
jgi:hypothetical protein